MERSSDVGIPFVAAVAAAVVVAAVVAAASSPELDQVLGNGHCRHPGCAWNRGCRLLNREVSI